MIFKDMMYGLGAGLVLTGLTMVVVNDYDNAGRKLALGSSVGAVLGIGLGFYELSKRDCVVAQEIKPGWQTPSFAIVKMDQQNNYMLGLRYLF